MSIYLELPDDVLASARMSVDEARLELALALYARRRLSFGKARELAQLSVWQFRQQLAAREIPVHLDTSDLNQEIEMLKQLDQL